MKRNENENMMLLTTIDEIVWEKWNPLGLDKTHNAKAYDSYIVELVDLMNSNVTIDKIERYLQETELHKIHVTLDNNRCKYVAKNLFECQVKFDSINPWLTIWFSPKRTMRYALMRMSSAQVFLIFIVLGFGKALDKATVQNLGDKHSLVVIFIFAAISAPISAYFALGIGGSFLTWATKKLGGIAEYDELKRVMAWASVPVLFSVFLWIPQIAIFGRDLFASGGLEVSENQELLLYACYISELVLVIWTCVIFIPCLAEANRFSNWRAIGSLFLIFAMILAIAFTITGIILLFKFM